MTDRQNNKSLYWAWKAMKQRCQNSRNKAYANYGGRGITVCEEWQQFEPFLEWALSNGYKKGLDLDRENNDLGYCPENCRWIGRRENINNRRNTSLLVVNGELLPETVWAELAGIDRALIKYWKKSRGKAYAQSRIEDILEHGYNAKDFGYGQRKPVLHVETQRRFRSVREAAQYFEIAPCTISNAMRQNRKTGKGRFVWEEN